jgi:hypothetical protein
MGLLTRDTDDNLAERGVATFWIWVVRIFAFIGFLFVLALVLLAVGVYHLAN